MKKLLQKLFSRNSSSDIRDTPAFVQFDIYRTISMLSSFAYEYPEFEKECRDVIAVLGKAIEKNRVLYEKSGCTVHFDGV